MLSDQPRFPDPAVREAVRAAFADAAYTEPGLARSLGPDVMPLMRLRGTFELARRARGNTAQQLLVRLFLAGLTATRDEVIDLLGNPAAEALRAAGLLAGDAVWRAAFGVAPVGERLIAHDRRDAHHEGAMDIVPGPGPATRRFADLAIHRPVHATLDLGCGQGALSVLAAAHSGRVTAVDLNPRAAAFSAFNTELNGLRNIACLQGDLFAPVAGQRFDLILSNPPFVISPASTFLYRDGGGGICERIVREAPAYLAEGGILQVVCNWPCYRGRDWKEDLAGWFRGSGCDVWILETDHYDAAVYAGIWLRQEHEDLSRIGPEFDRWMAYYENAGIEAVGGGVVAMRSPVGRASARVGRASVPVSPEPWLEIRDMPPCIGPAGETMARVLEARDVLARMSDDAALLGAKLRLAPEAKAFVTQRPSARGWEQEAAELRLTQGLAMALRLDPVGAALAGYLDGGRTAGEAVAAFAASSGVAVEALLPGVAALVRRMIELGLVVLPAIEATASRTGVA